MRTKQRFHGLPRAAAASDDGLVGCDFKPIRFWRLILGSRCHPIMFFVCSQMSIDLLVLFWLVLGQHMPAMNRCIVPRHNRP